MYKYIHTGPRTSGTLPSGWVVDALATGENIFFISFTTIHFFSLRSNPHTRMHAHALVGT